MNPSAVHVGETAAELIRPLGALERLFYRCGEHHPGHFSIVAEFDAILRAHEVEGALAEVQKRHPLLSVHVTGAPATRLGFYRAPRTAPIPLLVRDHCQWQSCAAEELARPFDRSTAPLMRAVLVKGPSHSAVLLTFDHTIADEVSSTMIVRDLLAALNGRSLEALAVPPHQEIMLARALTSGGAVTTLEQPETAPRIPAPAFARPYDGTAPYLHAVAMSAAWTGRLLTRCQAEDTTVHAALVTAACRIRGQRLGEDYVRVLSPIDVRSLIGAGDDCAGYSNFAVTSVTPRDGSLFWNQARTTGAQLSEAGSASRVLANSTAVARSIGVHAGTDAFFTPAGTFDMMISNLRVHDLGDAGRIRPRALWTPVLGGRIANGVAIGATTFDGVLRMVASGDAPTAEFLEAVAGTLRTATQLR
jgi:hypothetical protein